MGGQIPAGMSVSPYGPPGNQFMTQKPKSRAIKIVDPHTHEELKLDPVKKDSSVEIVAPSGLGSAGRVSSNGLIQPRAPVGYSPSHHMPFYYQTAPKVYQPGPGLAKAGGFSGAPLSSSPPVRYNFNSPHPGQGVTFGHPGTAQCHLVQKLPLSWGPCLRWGLQVRPGPVDMLSTPLVGLPIALGPPPVTVPGIPAQAGIANPRPNPPPLGMNPPIMSNGRPPSLSVPPVSPPAPLTPSSVLPSPTSSIAFKFGDVEASGSSVPVAGSDASSEGSVNGANGHASTGVDSTGASVGPSYVGSLSSGRGFSPCHESAECYCRDS